MAGRISQELPAQPEPSALEVRAKELIMDNLEVRKADKGEEQDPAELLSTLEEENKIRTITDRFKGIQELQKEKDHPMKSCPLTNLIFNEVKDYESHVQDGRGGGKPDAPTLPIKKKE